MYTIEVFLDYVCPFSAKMFRTLYKSLSQDIFNSRSPYANRVEFIFRQQIQPWHPTSTLVHESALAVKRLAPEKFIQFSDLLFSAQELYFDEAVVDETRNNTYARLSLIADELEIDPGKFMELVSIHAGKPKNAGNEVTNDVKAIVKANRLKSVHVTPTVMLNGVEQKDISSSFTAAEWKEWLNVHCPEE